MNTGARVTNWRLVTVGKCITVAEFVEGAADRSCCPMCQREVVYQDWKLTYAGTGADQHAVLRQLFSCECGHEWQTHQRIDHSWMIGFTVTQIIPNEDMVDEYYELIGAGFVPGTWADVVRMNQAYLPPVREGGAA